MTEFVKMYYEKRGQILVKNLKNRHFDAYYVNTREEALAKALELIPEGASVGWGGVLSADQIGLIDAIRKGNYVAFDRATAKTPEEMTAIMRKCLLAHTFITGANAISIDGQMVNIDGNGNRVAAIVYGPESVIVIAGMNKVEDSLEAAMNRARTVAAPMNKQRFPNSITPCGNTGTCADCKAEACICCKAEACICNQILITRHCRPVGRIKFILVGEELGL